MVPADSARISRVPAYSGAASVRFMPSPTGLSPSAAPLSRGLGWLSAVHSPAVLQPRPAPKRRRFGLLRVRSPLLAQSLVYFLFLRVLGCFSSPGSPPPLRGMCRVTARVAPFGNPRVGGYLLLSAAYRSLSRPSSPPRAKASFMCPSLLSFDLFISIGSNISRPALRNFVPSSCGPLQSPRLSFSRFVVGLLVLIRLLAAVKQRQRFASSMSMSSFLVENNGFEPLTPCLQSRCSSQLS